MTRIIWWAALLAGASFMLAVANDWSGAGIIAWKGSGVALLALWATVQAREADGWMIAGVMALGAAGDVLLDAQGLETGGLAFAAGHVLAVVLYLRNRRPELSASQRLLGWTLVPLSVGTVWLLLMGQGGWWHGAIYTAFVAAMAAAAWTSRFPRYRTGVGAILFLVSDLLIFARLGGAVPNGAATLLIWPLYFGGQALIVWGVVRALRGTTASN